METRRKRHARSPAAQRSAESTELLSLCFRYLVAGGLVDRVSRHSQALIETDFLLDQERESPLLVSSYDLLARLCRHLRRSADRQDNAGGGGGGGGEEQTSSSESHLLSSLSATEASGAIGALYAAVALTPQNQKGSSPTPGQTLATPARNLASRGLKLLRSIAELDLRTLQVGSRLPAHFRFDESVRTAPRRVADDKTQMRNVPPDGDRRFSIAVADRCRGKETRRKWI